jgi:hypothetical protein
MSGAPQDPPDRPDRPRDPRRRLVPRRWWAAAGVSVVLVVAVLTAVPGTALAAAPPVTAMSFTPSGIQANGTSTVTVTITDPAANSGVALQGVAFTDDLPANLLIANPSGLGNTCGGTASAAAGSNGLSLANGSVAAGSSCTVTAVVTGPDTGSFLNSTGQVTTTNAGTGAAATATLTIAAPPSLSTLFVADSVPENGQSLASFTLTNPNSAGDPPNVDITLTGVAFSDTLPPGLVVANPSDAFTDCGGTLSAVPGSATIALSQGTIAPASDQSNGNCSVSVEVAPTATGALDNTTGPVTANESGPGAVSNTFTLTVGPAADVAPPTLTESMDVPSVPVTGTAAVSFTVSNPNANTDLVDVGFADPLPAGLRVATPNAAGGTCVSDDGGSLSAGPGSASIGVDGITLAANATCTVTVAVVGTAPGIQDNTTQGISGRYVISSDSDGDANLAVVDGAPAGAALVVVGPPTMGLGFAARSVPVAGTTTLAFTLADPAANPVAVTGVTFSDELPGGLRVAADPTVTGTCDGTVTATAGSSTIALSGGSIATGAACTLTVAVTGAAEGFAQDTTSAISSDNGGTGPGATASVFVGSPPTLSAAFSPGRIVAGQASTLTVTLGNPNTAPALTGVSFAAPLPRGLAVAHPATTTCHGVLTEMPGGAGASLAGATLSGGSRCTVTVHLRAITAGTKRLSTGPPSAHETVKGTGGSATLTVVPSNRFRVSSVRPHADGSVSLTVRLPGPGVVAVLATAWNSDLSAPAAAALLRPARGRFVFGRARATAHRGGDLRIVLRPSRVSRNLVRAASACGA